MNTFTQFKHLNTNNGRLKRILDGFSMINALTTQNVNSIWEHSLLDPAASKHLRRKPQPKDSLHSVKSDFIQAKHRKLAYVFRPRRDDVPCNATELSRQLHSSVRSSNLDTSLRLLVQGADPNYFNHEKGTSCLHVACRTGNAFQAELLVAWGADPNAKDLSGNTPASSARLGGHLELADRMVELVYEVTDRLSYHLCNKKPDHKNGQHYIGLDKIESHEMTEVAKAARGKLQLLPNHLFEELIMDIYDEVDRRECEAVWVTSAMGLERFGVAFLPVNPALSAPRNQGRQKLARLSASEMAALLRDILMDASRRQHIATLKPNSMSSLSQKGHTKLNYLKQMTHLSDDEPLYDSVASDDDYAALVPSISKENKDPSSPKLGETVSKHYDANMPINDSFPMQNIANINNEHHNNMSSVLNVREIEQLRKQINLKDSTIEELKSELKQLQSAVENLKIENVLLKNSADKRSSVVSSNSPPTRDMSSPQICNSNMDKENNGEYHSDDLLLEVRTIGRSNQRPNSMYETRERPKFNWNVTKQQLKSIDANNHSIKEVSSSKETATNSTIELPTPSEVHKHAEVVTKGIQELWSAVQEPSINGYTFEPKANKIASAVDQLVSIFPEKCDESVSSVLCQLSSSCKNLGIVCARWNVDSEVVEVDVSIDKIRSAAYELAKATKTLVSNFPLDSSDDS